MKKIIHTSVVYLLVFSMAVSGCAGFHPTRMPYRELNDYAYQTAVGGVTIAADSLDREAVEAYFASNLPSKNIWPVPMLIRNDSAESLIFSKGLIQPESTTSHAAARRGRRSVGHRFFWGTIFFITFFGIPLAIPLFITGFRAMASNSSMETDYKSREIPDGTLRPGEYFQGVVYFHRPAKPESITVNFLNEETSAPLEVPLHFTGPVGSPFVRIQETETLPVPVESVEGKAALLQPIIERATAPLPDTINVSAVAVADTGGISGPSSVLANDAPQRLAKAQAAA